MPRQSLFTIEQTRKRRWLVISVPLPSFAIAERIRQHFLDYLISTVLFVGGMASIGYVLLQPVLPPEPTNPPAKVVSAAPAPEQPPSLSRSLPTHIDIPNIQLSTDLIELGKNADGTLEVPSDYVHAGWYRYSPTPGEIGPAIIAGHVDNYLGPAVFFYLKDLQPGQLIHITRQDGSVASFKVDSVELFDQNAFPTEAVYGNIDHAGLRLITCGGKYNSLTGRYSHNTVVYASFVPNS